MVAFSKEYRTIRTTHFQIHYPVEQKAIAVTVAQLAEDVHNRLEPRYQSGAQSTQIVLVFDSDLINAFATTYGMDRIILYMTAPPVHDFARFNDWISQLIEHEYTHIVTLRPYNGLANILLRWISGMPPNLLAADGIAEGYAVYEESTLQGNPPTSPVGRLHDTQTLSMIDTLFLYDALPKVEEVLTGSERWPYHDIAYLFGGRLISYLRQRCGNDTMDQFFQSKVPVVFLDWRLQSLQCDSIDVVFDDFIASEAKESKERLLNQFEDGWSDRKQLTFDGGVKTLLTWHHDSVVYFAKPEATSAGLYSFDGRRSHLLYRANTVSGYVPSSYGFITSELRSVLPGSIYTNQLHSNGWLLFDDDLRRESVAGNDSKVVYIRRADPWIELITINRRDFENDSKPDTKTETILFRLPMSMNIANPVVAKDGTVAVTVKHYDSIDHSIIVCKEHDCQVRLTVSATIANVSFYGDADDTSSLVFASDVGGVYDIYQFDFHQVRRLTRSLTGFYAPLLTSQGLYVIGNTRAGNELFFVNHLVNVQSDDKVFDTTPGPFDSLIPAIQMNADQPQTIDDSAAKTIIGDSDSMYIPLFSFRPFATGVVDGPISYLNAGVAAYDALDRHSFSAGIGQFEGLRSYQFASYTYSRFYPDISVSYAGMPLDKTSPYYCEHFRNRQLINYCLGERRFSFQESRFSIDFLLSFRLLQNRLTFFSERSLLRNTERLSTDSFRLSHLDLADVGLTYQVYYFETYSRSISPEKGFFAEVSAKHYPSGWNRGYTYSTANSAEPVRLTFEEYLARFELYLPFFFDYHVPVIGGSMSHIAGRDFDIKQSRLSSNMAGIDPDKSQMGQNVQILYFEYRLPVWQSRRRLIPRYEWMPFSTPSLGISSAALIPFVATGQAYNDASSPAKWQNTQGIKLDMQLYAFYQPFTLQLTYARGDGAAGESQFSLGFSVGMQPKTLNVLPLQHSQHQVYRHQSYLNR